MSSARRHHRPAAGPPGAGGGSDDQGFGSVPPQPGPLMVPTGRLIAGIVGMFLLVSTIEQWSHGYVVVNACIAGGALAIIAASVAVRLVRNGRIRLRHRREFTAMVFTGTITARERYGLSMAYITARDDADGRSISFLLPANPTDPHDRAAPLVVGQHVSKRAGDRWPSVSPHPLPRARRAGGLRIRDMIRRGGQPNGRAGFSRPGGGQMQ